MNKLRWLLSKAGFIYKKAKLSLGGVKRKIVLPALPENKDGKVYIHLGCGEINCPGFINIDLRPFSHVHYIRRAEELDIFPNNYADLIYACHILEHYSHTKITKVLEEWFRVLKKTGILRLSVPDFDKCIEIYNSHGKNIGVIQKNLMGGQNYADNYHKTIFNEESLRSLLLSVGFREVREWDPNVVELHSFDDWASRKKKIGSKEYPISLNIEAIK